jgi:hypothetical protein
MRKKEISGQPASTSIASPDRSVPNLFAIGVASCLLVFFGTSVEAADATPPVNGTNSPLATNVTAKIKYRPASTGTPSVRLTGGSRGTGDASVILDVLAPEDVGLTTQEQPSLFWYQSKPAKAKFELTLLQEDRLEPLVQVSGEHALQTGIQRLRLSEHNAKLAVGVEYQWVVALITDPDNRSSDLVASGVIKRIEPPAALKRQIESASRASLAGVYAEAGIWYDALSSLTDQIEAAPANKALQEARADLLRQAGLKVSVGNQPFAAK